MERQERQTVRDALRWAARLLSARGDTSPRLDAEVLLAHVLGIERADLPLRWDRSLEQSKALAYASLVRRRAEREPVAYLVGHRAFWDLDLQTDARVLIPRPETEHILEEAQAWLRGRSSRALTIADVGTGSGALAVALARMAPGSVVLATDASPAALALTRENARAYGVLGAVHGVCCDLLSAVGERIDLLVANLPYVRSDGIAALDADIRDYEPRLALDGGLDGLDLIRRLLADAPRVMSGDGLILLEIDPRQVDAALLLGRAAFPTAACDVIRDLAGRYRLVRLELGGTLQAQEAFE